MKIGMLSKFAIMLTSKIELIVFLVCCDYKCFLTLPHGAMDWFAMCGCGIS